jgi:hypothetical protein
MIPLILYGLLEFTLKKKKKLMFNFKLLSIPLFTKSILTKAMLLLRIHKINLII